MHLLYEKMMHLNLHVTGFFQKDTEAAQWVEALYAKGYTKV